MVERGKRTLLSGVFTGPSLKHRPIQQGETVRIMYIHVPSAWLAMACCSIMTISSIGTLVWRHPLADVSSKAWRRLARPSHFSVSSRVRSGQTDVGHVVGMGRTPDVRTRALPDLRHPCTLECDLMTPRAGRTTAVMTLVGAINLPIVKFRWIGGTRSINRRACSGWVVDD